MVELEAPPSFTTLGKKSLGFGIQPHGHIGALIDRDHLLTDPIPNECDFATKGRRYSAGGSGQLDDVADRIDAGDAPATTSEDE